jgi:DNA polymerase-3 subunit beta
MRFVTERPALLAVLAAAVRIVSPRTTIPILSNVLVTAEGDAITVATTNLDIRVTARVPAEVERPGATTLPAKILHDIVRAMPADARLTVDAQEGDRATLRHGRSRQTLATLPAGDYPDAGVGAFPKTFEVTGATLARQLARCLIAASTEETRYYLNGVLFHAEGAGPERDPELRLVATDGHRLVRSSVPLPAGAEDLPWTILPRTAAIEVQKLAAAASGSIGCAFGERLVAFTFPSGLRLVTKTIEGTFPDYGRVVPVGNDKRVTVPRSFLTSAIERVALVRDAESRGGAVRFTADPDEGRLTLQVSTPTNEAVEQVDAESDHHFETGFNPNYLRELLGAVDGEMIEFGLGEAGSPALISAVGDASTTCVLMPMRV